MRESNEHIFRMFVSLYELCAAIAGNMTASVLRSIVLKFKYMKEKTFFRRRKKHAENILNKHCRSTYTYVYCIGSEFNRKANERRQKTPTNDISHRRISFDLGLLIFIHYFIVIKRSALTGIRIHNISFIPNVPN